MDTGLKPQTGNSIDYKPNKNKIIITSIALVLSVIIIGVCVYLFTRPKDEQYNLQNTLHNTNETDTPNVTQPTLITRVINEKMGEFVYPQGWQVVVKPNENSLFAFHPPATPKSDSIFEYPSLYFVGAEVEKPLFANEEGLNLAKTDVINQFRDAGDNGSLTESAIFNDKVLFLKSRVENPDSSATLIFYLAPIDNGKFMKALTLIYPDSKKSAMEAITPQIEQTLFKNLGINEKISKKTYNP